MAFAFVNGSYLALSGLHPAANIEVQLTHSGGTPATEPPSPAAFDHISAVNGVELRPTESKFTLINA